MRPAAPAIVALALVGALGLSCGGAERSPAAAPMRVLQRLGPGDFGLPAGLRPPMAAIAGDARPVLQAPRSRRLGSAWGLAADAEGRVHARFPLDAEIAARPDAAFVLDVQELPGAIPEEAMPKLAQETFVRRVNEGWTLTRGEGEASVAWDAGRPDAGPRYNLHLSLLEPDRLEARSEPLAGAPGAVLELAFGRATSAASPRAGAARFRAELRCPGDEPRVLVDAVLDAASAGWQESAARLPGADARSAAGCRLSLLAEGARGDPVHGALWALPRIIAPAGERAPGDANLVLISLDTLRADHLSGYGYPRPTSPRIDAELIAQGTAFLDVTSTYSRTDVSHMSLLSGLYPEARPDPGRLHPETPAPLLAERLADAGFQTAAFAEDALLSGAFGFWFGFDRFDERPYPGAERGVHTFERARAWLRAHADRRFFLLVHTYKTHAPYAAGEAYATLFRDPADWERAGMDPVPARRRELADEYDRTIREADDLVGSLLDELAALGLAGDTLVVLTSDHGEAFGEHGLLGHSISSHQEVMRVPLVLRGPGVPAGLRVDAPVSLVDLAPTLLDWLGLAPLPRSQGISLLPALRGEPLPARRPLYFSWHQQPGVGVRYGPWKFHRRPEGGLLYDLSRDPGERAPVGSRGADRPYADRLLGDHARESARIREELAREGVGRVAPALSPDVEESLRALGYIE